MNQNNLDLFTKAAQGTGRVSTRASTASGTTGRRGKRSSVAAAAVDTTAAAVATRSSSSGVMTTAATAVVYPPELAPYQTEIEEVVTAAMETNTYFTDRDIVLRCKIDQLAYLVRNPEYAAALTDARNAGNRTELLRLLQQNETDVYAADWQTHRDHLVSYNAADQLTPNCDDECGRCHKRLVHFTQQQLRSGDEGATTIFRCLNCGNVWSKS